MAEAPPDYESQKQSENDNKARKETGHSEVDSSIKSQAAAVKGSISDAPFDQDNSPSSESDDADPTLIERLLGIINRFPDDDRARLELFACRIALRLFGLAIDRIAVEQRRPEVRYGADEIIALWHNLLICWQYSESTEFANIPDDLVNSESSFRLSNQLYLLKTAESLEQAARCAARCFGSATKRLMQITRNDALLKVVEFDLEALSSTDSLETIRAIALWPENLEPGELATLAWLQGLQALSENSTDQQIKKHLMQIAVDYQTMLYGNVDDKNILQIAVDKQESDKPSATDHLGRDQLINALLPRLSVADDKGHLTIGLLGDWGIGKSSVIRMLTQSLKSIPHCEYVVANFNAWSYENTPNIQAGIAHEIISALSSQNEWPRFFRWLYKPLVIARFAARLHGKRILWILFLVFLALIGVLSIVNMDGLIEQGFTGAGLVVAIGLVLKDLRTVSAQPLAKELNTYLRLPSYHQHLGTIPEMENNLKTLCDLCLGKNMSKTNRRLMFFVDDLDRCGVDGIVKTFEAIRLVLDIPWVTVVIAVDQRIALPALACHYEKLSKYHMHDPMSIARDYLAKLIHLPISLPAPDDLAVAQYLGHLWQDTAFSQQAIDQRSIDSDSPSVDSKGSITLENSSEEKNDHQIDLQQLFKIIDEFDVSSTFSTNDDDESETEQSAGFSEAHKNSFYLWLCRFNLRNPRQIKRLYNGYNLLWAHIGSDSWNYQGEKYFPPMMALLALEMINEHVLNLRGQNLRKAYRLRFFNASIKSSELDISGIELKSIDACRTIILQFQQETGADLLNRIEPFVLPAIGSSMELN